MNNYNLNVSSATIRNDMADLERAGLIMQPHTSAGRIPSDRGYRYFVTNLMNPTALSQDEQRTIRHQFHQIEMDAEEWVRLAASVLARTVHSAAVATAPRSTAVRLKHFELLAISDTRILLVLVGDDGSVTQQMLTVSEAQDQGEMSTLAGKLNAPLGARPPTKSPPGPKTKPTSSRSTRSRPRCCALSPPCSPSWSAPKPPIFTTRAWATSLSSPSSASPSASSRSSSYSSRAASGRASSRRYCSSEGVQVIIGEEGSPEGIASCSVVLARYGMEEQDDRQCSAWWAPSACPTAARSPPSAICRSC